MRTAPANQCAGQAVGSGPRFAGRLSRPDGYFLIAGLLWIGLILASDNAVALDAVIATMMGCAPERLRFLRKARAAGLGDYDLKTIDVIGELKPLPDFKLPPLGGEAILNNPAMQAAMHNRMNMRPQADRQRCTGCGTCIDQCPVAALSMQDDLPRVDADTCIACFCCQEICP
ncbi:MAG: 4Fe-4S dicluster domain-containing protein, partial [Desulfofustis sp.]|nr:4Fe-4S dicluster domain-containing protein [Desulfofustis sp.]